MCECGFTPITLTFAFYIYVYIYIYMMQIKQAAGKGLKYLEAHFLQRPKARLLANSKMTCLSLWSRPVTRGWLLHICKGSLALLTAKTAASASQAAGNSSPHAFTGHQHCSYQVRRERDVDHVNIIIVILRWNWCTELNIASHKKKRSFILMLTKCFKEKQHLKCRWY